MTTTRARVGLTTATVICLASHAHACGTGPVLFEDSNFSNPSWDVGDRAGLTRAASGLAAELAADQAHTLLNQASLYGDVEVCASFTVAYPAGWEGWVGLAFWAVDESNNYSVALVPNDQAVGIYRGQNGRTLQPVPYFTTEAIKKEANSVNELSITLTGNHAIVRINGTVVKEFDGYPPAGGGLVGVELGTTAASKAPASIVISGFQVRTIEAPAAQITPTAASPNR